MKIFLLSIGLAWVVLSAQAQWKEPWSKGEIILADGERLAGELVFASDAEVVSLKMGDGTLKAYNSAQIQSFHFQDIRRKFLRRFKTSVLPDSGREAIVEIVIEGAVEVQRCLRNRPKGSFGPIYNYFPDEPIQHSVFRYYVHDGLYLCSMEHFLKKTYRQKTGRWRSKLDLFKTRNNLDNGIESWLRVLLFYNALEEEWRERQLPFEKIQTTDEITL
ncbi:hypothetical protein [Runella sp.]|uniref:hypothetical protein n=1 Tax=Runella sp. TaxID=1960881 RepID=UPI003D0C97D3